MTSAPSAPRIGEESAISTTNTDALVLLSTCSTTISETFDTSYQENNSQPPIAKQNALFINDQQTCGYHLAIPPAKLCQETSLRSFTEERHNEAGLIDGTLSSSFVIYCSLLEPECTSLLSETLLLHRFPGHLLIIQFDNYRTRRTAVPLSKVPPRFATALALAISPSQVPSSTGTIKHCVVHATHDKIHNWLATLKLSEQFLMVCRQMYITPLLGRLA